MAPLGLNRSPPRQQRLLACPPVFQENFGYNERAYDRRFLQSESYQHRYQPYREWRYPHQILPGQHNNAFYV